MTKTTKTGRIAAIAATAAFAAAPSSALARVNLENGSPPPTPVTRAPVARHVTPLPAPALRAQAATSSPGFQWDDAGIGAAGMLAILGMTSVATRRRRVGRAVAG